MNSTNETLKNGKRTEMIIIAVAAIFAIAVMALLLLSHMNKTSSYISEPVSNEVTNVSDVPAETPRENSEEVPANTIDTEESESTEPAPESVEDKHRKKDEIISKITSLDRHAKTDETIDASDLDIDDAKDIVYGACREMDLECCESKANSDGSFSCLSSGYIYDDEINNENEEPILCYMRFDYDVTNRTLKMISTHTAVDRSRGDIIETLEELEKQLADEYEGFYITIL